MKIKVAQKDKTLKLFIGEEICKDKEFDKPKVLMFKFKTKEHWMYKQGKNTVNSIYDIIEHFISNQDSKRLTVVILDIKDA